MTTRLTVVYAIANVCYLAGVSTEELFVLPVVGDELSAIVTDAFANMDVLGTAQEICEEINEYSPTLEELREGVEEYFSSPDCIATKKDIESYCNCLIDIYGLKVQ